MPSTDPKTPQAPDPTGNPFPPQNPPPTPAAQQPVDEEETE
jgi:hypothetical protein